MMRSSPAQEAKEEGVRGETAVAACANPQLASEDDKSFDAEVERTSALCGLDLQAQVDSLEDAVGAPVRAANVDAPLVDDCALAEVVEVVGGEELRRNEDACEWHRR